MAKGTQITGEQIRDFTGGSGGGGGGPGWQIDQSGGTGDTFGTLAGDRDGANVEFTVSAGEYVSGSLSVYLNGQLQTQGTAEDWHEATPGSGTFHFTTAPEATDEITVIYGGGDVVGPAGATDGNLAVFDGATGKLLKDGGAVPSGGTFIGARYESDAGQSFANSTETIINFEDVIYDPDSLVTVGASWKFTAPSAGYYHLDASFLTGSYTSLGAGEVHATSIYIDNSKYCEVSRRNSESSTDKRESVQVSIDFYLALNSYVDLRWIQISGGAMALISSSGYTWINIHKIG